jgi:hypothetical protein
MNHKGIQLITTDRSQMDDPQRDPADNHRQIPDGSTTKGSSCSQQIDPRWMNHKGIQMITTDRSQMDKLQRDATDHNR